MDPVADITLRSAFALLFLVAASHKLRDPGRFRTTLADYRLLPGPVVPLAAMLVIGVEVVVAIALVASARRTPGPVAAAALTAVAPVRPRPLVWVDVLTVLGATGTLAALYASADRLLAHAPALARLRGEA